jgi:RimJ/RimL family protein N-acetyltransferase
MANTPVRLVDNPDFGLRTITDADLDNLRVWKNATRLSFFHQQEILPDQQQTWYSGYQQRPHDYMFVVSAAGRSIGCMGIRLCEQEWDVYNVILGEPEFRRRGLMSMAFRRMLQFALAARKLPITLKVLKTNPAVAWYEKNGFQIVADGGNHFGMRLTSDPDSQPSQPSLGTSSI